jgi:anthranilate synthase component 1
MNKIVLKPYMKTFSGDTETPITLFYKYVGEEIGFLLESRTTDSKGRYSFMGKNPQAILSGKQKLIIQQKDVTNECEGKLLEAVRDYLDQFEIIEAQGIPFTGGAVGAIAYDTIRQYEKLPETNPDVLGMPDVHMMVFTEVIAYDHLHGRISVIVLEDPTEQGKKAADSKIAAIEAEILKPVDKSIYEFDMEQKKNIGFTSNRTKEEYMDMVKKAKQYIYDGDIFQVVLSQRLTANVEEKPLQLYRRLRAINPSPYLYYLNFGDYQVAGSSPEMIVELRGDKVYTCPIAGSRKRGKDSAEDIRLANDLLNDPKEKAEHVMLVDLARNDMGRISQIGSVKVTDFMKVQNYSHIMHLVSLVEGKKRKDATPFEILSTFLPAGTLSGAPKIRAMEIIEELEPERRGLYGGAVGYFGFNGDMDFCIAIRTMVIKDGKVYMQAGAGIVADSDPETEYEESHSKVRALVKTIGGEI